ncbi:rho GTPase-activating protein 39 [Chanos chanos]|uniref:Rho GTPase-activating protein 39 n=1 Tax=Chanos chanos TaxID=29144 RepID=A0A6J2UZT7_CHACN|nr:rho GTPase-activating protein 39-like [Chanos chanos]
MKMAETRSDWVEILEPRSNERMYVNLTTGECGWAPPTGVPVRRCDGNQWWELFDANNNRFYYYNCTSQQTVWHRPQGCDIIPLAQLQAMKRTSESELRGPGRAPRGSESREECGTPLSGNGGVVYSRSLSQEVESSGRETPSKGCTSSLESRREHSRETAQRWQPAPGSKAAMLVKVNSIGKSQSGSSTTSALLHMNLPTPSATKPAFLPQLHNTMPVPGDAKQALQLKKSSNNNVCLVMPNSSGPSSQRSMGGASRPSSPQYGSTAPIYDEPPLDTPIYDEPPMEMEVEAAHLLNRGSTSSYTAQKGMTTQPGHPQPPKLLQYPLIKHKRNPSASEYSPAGRECIKHMVNVDPSASRPNTQPSSPIEGAPSMGSSQIQPQAVGAAQAKAPLLEKKQSWRGLEGRHSRQSSLASQEYPGPAAVTYQDSGYSTGPSPSLRRKNRRRAVGPSSGPGAGSVQGGRPGSIGSSGELNALNEKLMAEMRAVVNRSNTLHGSKASLDTEMSSDVTTSNRSLYHPGSNHGDGSSAMEGGGVRQKRTYEKVDSLEKSVTSQMSLSLPEPTVSTSQAGTLDSQAQLVGISLPDGSNGHPDTLGSHNSAVATGNNNNTLRSGGASFGSGSVQGVGGYQYPYATLGKPPPESNMVDWASKNLNLHTQGLFRRRVSIANMLTWNRGSIKKPMLITNDRVVKKEACEMFKLVQVYMWDRVARLDRRHAALLVVTKCWNTQGLRDELYVQLVRQTTGNMSLRSLAAGWELMAISLAFFSPSPKFRRYLEGYIQRHLEQSNDKKIMQQIIEQQDMKNKKNSKSRKKRKQNNEEEEEEGLPISTYAKYCYRKLQKVAVTGGKKGLRKPTLEEIDHSRNAIITPSLFGSALEEIMERQSELFPNRKLPWVQVQLSQYVLALGGAQTEGIFRVPGDIDEVNALKLQVDQWNIPENLSDPNVPASLLKLWYRELEEPVIPQNFYKQCISHYEDPEAAINVVQSLPELNRLVLYYFIHFLQVFAQPVNVSKTKMDVNNLAMVMAPNCLRCQSDDPRIIFENTRKEMSFLRMLIVHLDTSFIKDII